MTNKFTTGLKSLIVLNLTTPIVIDTNKINAISELFPQNHNLNFDSNKNLIFQVKDYVLIIETNKIAIDLNINLANKQDYITFISDLYSTLLSKIIKLLNVKFCNRIGFRYIFEKKIQFTEESYSNFTSELNSLISHTNNDTLNNIINKSNNTFLKTTVQYDKNNTKSYNLVLTTTQNKMNFQGMDFNIASFNIDLDYFQTGNINIINNFISLTKEFTNNSFENYTKLKEIWGD